MTDGWDDDGWDDPDLDDPDFDGATYDPELDHARLSGELARVRRVMKDARWRTLEMLAKRTKQLRGDGGEDSEAGLSARLRDLRKKKFGGHEVLRRRDPKVKSLHWYKLILRTDKSEAPPVIATSSPYNQNMSKQPLIVRHRPVSFNKVVGHKETVAALSRRVRDPGRPHAYLFTGPSGVGKTTLARIIGTELEADIIEIDAASNNGVDAMRELVELGQHMPMGTRARLMILDECHMLSRAAWNAILKLLEEPPAHLHVALCTTEPGKVPDTVATRCYHIKLDRLTDRQISDLVIEVLAEEGWANTLREDVFPLIVTEAEGSARRALSLLQTLYDAPSLAEAKRIITLHGTDSPVIAVIRAVMEGRNWEAIRPLLARLSDDDFSDGSLTLASRYIIGAMQREDVGKRAARLWEMLAAFLYPVNSYDPKAVFYAAIGRILWSGP